MPLDDTTTSLLIENRSILTKCGIDYSSFEPTANGLKKSILDATNPVRSYFRLVEFHDYTSQAQGKENKVIKDAYFVGSDEIKMSRMSLYRPNTKKGDPRMWFKNLGNFANAGDEIAIILFDGRAYLLNLCSIDLSASIKAFDSIGQLFSRITKSDSDISKELLSKLREIAKKSIPAVGKGDKSVGMTIEAALGIPANSSKMPDYKGIELKSAKGIKTRSNLFAQVADWKRSVCKSSREILEHYGYPRGNDFKLNCTLSTKNINSQGLTFKYCSESDDLHEKHSGGKDVAVWSGDKLRERLLEKHSETFWIQATTEKIGGVEYFSLKSVVHTKSPLLNQLMPLIENGIITMDHLIKKTGGKKPKIKERGPLFKIKKTDLPLLFPNPVEYSLVE